MKQFLSVLLPQHYSPGVQQGCQEHHQCTLTLPASLEKPEYMTSINTTTQYDRRLKRTPESSLINAHGQSSQKKHWLTLQNCNFRPTQNSGYHKFGNYLKKQDTKIYFVLKLQRGHSSLPPFNQLIFSNKPLLNTRAQSALHHHYS